MVRSQSLAWQCVHVTNSMAGPTVFDAEWLLKSGNCTGAPASVVTVVTVAVIPGCVGRKVYCSDEEHSY